MNFDLRTLRRSHGLTQTDLADLVGVDQATISRWERGVEQIRRARRHELLDVFLNKRGRLDPLIEDFVRQHPCVGVLNRDDTFLYLSPGLTQATQTEHNELLRHRYSDVTDTSWRDELLRSLPPEECLMVDVTHDLVGKGICKGLPTVGARTHGYWLSLDTQHSVFVGTVKILPPTGMAPVISKFLTISDVIDE